MSSGPEEPEEPAEEQGEYWPDFAGDFWKGIFGGLGGLAGLLIDWDAYFDLVLCAGKQTWCSTIYWYLDFMKEWFLDPFFEYVPPPPESWDWSWLGGLWGTANHYTPAAEMLVMATAWTTMYGVVILWRLIKSHVPGWA